MQSESDLILKLCAAFICGGIIGLEREITGKVAGLRTSILVCVGATIFTMLSVVLAQKFGGDPTRIAAQIVTGVGFLGAGAILREEGRGITGLTTAAVIWVTAAIGMMIGSDMIILSIILSLLIVLCMFLLSRFEEWIHKSRSRLFHLTVRNNSDELDHVKSLLTIYKKNISGIAISDEDTPQATLSFYFAGANTQRHDFLRLLNDIDGVHVEQIDN